MTRAAPPDRPDPGGHAVAVLTALLVTVLWSSSWVLIRRGLDDEDLDPLTFAGVRYGIAAVVLVAVVSSRGITRQEIRRSRRPDRWRLVTLGVVFYAVTQGAQYVAIDHQPAATTSLVLSMTPLLVAVIARRTLGEPATRRQLGGAALVVAGAALYAVGGLGATAIGLTAAAVGLAANAASGLLGRRVNREASLSPVVVTAMSMTVGATLLLAVGLVIEGWPSWSGRAMVIVLWLAVVNTALANTLWNRSQRHLDAVESAGINNTMLVQIAALGWVFLDEVPGPVAIAGIVLVSLGVYLTQRAALSGLGGEDQHAERGEGEGDRAVEAVPRLAVGGHRAEVADT